MKRLIYSLTNVTDLEITAFLKHVETIDINAGECLLKNGEDADFFGVVETGLFKISYEGLNGNDCVKTFRGPGGLIGSYADYLNCSVSRVNVQALKSSKISRFKMSLVEDFYSLSPSWEKLGRKIAEVLYCEKEDREYQFLCLDAAKRYESFLKKFPVKQFSIPDYLVASYLGITPVYLSKLKKGRDI